MKNILFRNFIFGCLILVFLFFGLALAEGTKVLTNKDMGISITVPEMAPEFFSWEAAVVGMEDYPNGNSLYVLQSLSPDKNIAVMSLWGKQDGKLHLLAFAVKYFIREDAGFEIYEDTGFLKTGKPTGFFTRVDKASPTDAFKFHMTKIKL